MTVHPPAGAYQSEPVARFIAKPVSLGSILTCLADGLGAKEEEGGNTPELKGVVLIDAPGEGDCVPEGVGEGVNDTVPDEERMPEAAVLSRAKRNR